MEIRSINDIEGIFNSYYEALCIHAYKLVKDKDAAEDIVQDVFTKVWIRRDEITINTSVKSYLYRSTTNTALNYLERNKRTTTEAEDVLEGFVGNLPNPETQAMNNELENSIQEAIEALPPKCRVVFTLSREEGYKYHEIAKELDISIKTVENQMRIALERIRGHIKKFV